MSFFARRAQPKTESSAPPDPSKSLFSHSGSFLSQQKERIEREKRQAEKEKEREQRRNEKRERKASAKRESPEGETGERKSDLKRRRISSKEKEKLLQISGIPQIQVDSSEDEVDRPSSAARVRRSPRHTRTTTDDYGLSKSKSMVNHVTATPIDDLNDEFEIIGSVSRPAQPSSEVEDEFSDPELAELSRNARRAARAQHTQDKKMSSDANISSEKLDAGSDQQGGLSTSEQHDPIITIFITSDIPNTGQLLIRRKMSQPLGKVRIAWCEKFKLSDEMKNEVFLAFCGRRQYDSTTCQRLGLKVDVNGQPVREDGNSEEPQDQVHVEAFTEALFAERKAEKAREAKTESSKYDIEEEVEAEAEPEPEPKEIKIVIRAKGKADCRLKVSPHHTIAKIIKGAKKAFGFSSDQAVRIEFDGEALDPDQTVGDTEIEDMDSIDMYLES